MANNLKTLKTRDAAMRYLKGKGVEDPTIRASMIVTNDDGTVSCPIDPSNTDKPSVKPGRKPAVKPNGVKPKADAKAKAKAKPKADAKAKPKADAKPTRGRPRKDPDADRDEMKPRDVKPAGPDETCSNMCKRLILDGMTNAEVWDEIRVRFDLPDSARYYPAWNRSDLRRRGQLPAHLEH